MADYYIKQGDNYPVLYAQLVDANGDGVPLSGATIVINVRLHGSLLFSASCAIVTAATGHISYTWGDTDTTNFGNAQMEFVVTWTSIGKVSRFPDDRQLDLQITKNLTGS